MNDNKNYEFTGYNSALKEKARILRKNMTRQEKHLWYDFLRDYPIKFYRQRIIDNYIADFYCSKARLIIEVDGSQHYTSEGLDYDKIRTQILEVYGLKVIRFLNSDIDKHFNEVCEQINRIVKERL